nr:selenoprotein M-like [Onthophagus taurus]
MKHLLALVFLLIITQGIWGRSKSIRGRIESCPGCKLNYLKEVKQFIYEDVPKYADLTFKKIQGHPPELVILDEDDNEMERIPLEDKNREECNFLLIKKGFSLKLAPNSVVDDEL